MKFLVDAHLPNSLGRLLQSRGHDVLHVRQLPQGNRTSDRDLNDLSVRQERVVVSKDTDFYYSHLLHRRPYKLLLVKVGNCGTAELTGLFDRHLEAVIHGLEQHSLLELHRQAVRVII